MKKRQILAAGAIIFLLAGGVAANAATTITIHADQPGAKVNPAMWGIFFEDINFGADGGLYAELVKNRDFEFPDPFDGLDCEPGATGQRRSDRARRRAVERQEPALCSGAQSNGAPAFMACPTEGFRGMGVKAGKAYNFSARIRGVDGVPH